MHYISQLQQRHLPHEFQYDMHLSINKLTMYITEITTGIYLDKHYLTKFN